MADSVIASVVLNDMERTELAVHGFRSWMLQDFSSPYEVVINLFNDQERTFRMLSENRNPLCRPLIRTFPRPSFFNISAANNLGLHQSSGEYVLFCGSDVIFPSSYLDTVTDELRRRDISYVDGLRVNLGEARTRTLRPPSGYTPAANYDSLVGCELDARSGGVCAWIVRREVAREIGGFDSLLLCYEDADFNDRVLHYLRRKGAQKLAYTLSGIRGYHLRHEASELYDASRSSGRIVRTRRHHLFADASSTEDVVPSRLDSLDDLMAAVVNTPRPPWTLRNSRGLGWLRGIYRRTRAAIQGFARPL
jgi:hypothetical protein